MRPGQNYAVIQIKADGPRRSKRTAGASLSCVRRLWHRHLRCARQEAFRDFCFKPSYHATLVAEARISAGGEGCCQARPRRKPSKPHKHTLPTDVEQADKPATPAERRNEHRHGHCSRLRGFDSRSGEALAACLQAEPGQLAAAQFLSDAGPDQPGSHGSPESWLTTWSSRPGTS